MKYELLTIIHPASEGVAPQILAKIKEMIEAKGGSVTKTDDWGKRKLAYQIRKQDFGYYVILNVELPATSVTVLEKELNLMDEVIRYMIVKEEEIKHRHAPRIKKPDDSNEMDKKDIKKEEVL